VTSSSNLFRIQGRKRFQFQDFIRRKENEYEEGHDVGVNNLMADAVVKYRARCQEGGLRPPGQGQILALTAQVEQLKSSKPKLKQQHSAAAATTTGFPEGLKQSES
jgi:hypothetical protein